jgi:hypothetical protein
MKACDCPLFRGSSKEPLEKAAKPTDSEETVPETELGEEVPGEEVSGGDGSDDGLSGGADGSRSDGSRSDGIKPRPAEDVSAESLQSPYDPEATYRRKNGEEYPGGYVVAVSETCDPTSDVQLITDVQVAPNTTDDGELLKRSLEGQSRRAVAPDEMTTDGGFTGPTAEEACEAHGAELRLTRIRGGEAIPTGWAGKTTNGSEVRRRAGPPESFVRRERKERLSGGRQTSA